MTSFPADIKVRHLDNDARASLLVYDQEPPFRGVEIRTTAILSKIDTPEIIREMATRYLGKEAGEAYAAASSDLTLIRLEPGHIRTWDFADEF